MEPRNQTHPAGAWQALVLAAALCHAVAPAHAQEAQKPTVPKPSVPEIFTLEGQFVRIAYNNEGYVTLGYRTANYSIGQEWMLLEVGLTVREGQEACVLKRDAFSIKTPDGKIVPLATQKEYASVDLRGIQMMADGMRDTISYFPHGVVDRRRIGFFSDLDSRPLSHDQVELNDRTASFGRIYFRVPGGIKTGQHWLLVKFPKGTVEVPFRILTKEEEKEFRKTWKDIKKEHDESME